ncbi:hypothetical protein SELMODRAFT_402414 [Selaginella moellendorffii]|uniref:F-box domain-containing protein n=1 Tax=Selaginella moellendorffii TaxID=88036 RepID=D8QQJ7_SELML|nr:hypothetical protein SELMODRAFT_402414 [Selaginella moellendorffii]
MAEGSRQAEMRSRAGILDFSDKNAALAPTAPGKGLAIMDSSGEIGAGSLIIQELDNGAKSLATLADSGDSALSGKETLAVESNNVGKNVSWIPSWDLEVEVLRRLTLDDLARLRCVSKSWKEKVSQYVSARPSLASTVMIFQAKSPRLAYEQVSWLLNDDGWIRKPVTLPEKPGSPEALGSHLLRRRFIVTHSGNFLLVVLEPGKYAIYEPLSMKFSELPLAEESGGWREVLAALYRTEFACLINQASSEVMITTYTEDGTWLPWSKTKYDDPAGQSHHRWLELGVLMPGGSYTIVFMDLVRLNVGVLRLDGPTPQMLQAPRLASVDTGLVYFNGQEVKLLEITSSATYVPWTLDLENENLSWTRGSPWPAAPESFHKRVKKGNRGVPARVPTEFRQIHGVPAHIRVTERGDEVMFFVLNTAEIHCYNRANSAWGVKRLPKHGVPDGDGILLGPLAL